MATNVEDAKLNEKKERGKLLYETILSKYDNDVDKMYDAFMKKFENFKIYGNTKEKTLLNYCSFRNDAVERVYKVRV